LVVISGIGVLEDSFICLASFVYGRQLLDGSSKYELQRYVISGYFVGEVGWFYKYRR
jgi:hypothetical protein